MLGAVQIKDFIIMTLLFLISGIKRNWGGDGKKESSSNIMSNRKMQMITQK